MGEKRGEEDNPPRDMPLSVALKLLGWRSNTPAEKAVSWFDLDFEYGGDEKETSLNNMGFPPEQDFFITDQRGYWTIFSDFYKNFQNKILLNKVVHKIQYSDTGVTIATSDGEVFTADYALSTFSTGVLGSDLVTFNPPLPTWKREAIYRFRPVYFTKIFLKFPRDFWDDHEWIMHVSQNQSNFPTLYDLNRPGFFPGSNTLFTAVTGDEALRIEKQDDSKTKAEVMETLRKMYGQDIPNATGKQLFRILSTLSTLINVDLFKTSAFPLKRFSIIYFKKDSILLQNYMLYFLDIHVSKWSQNPYVQASWADPVVGTSWGHYDNLSGRLKNLFFAGEHTSGDWYGYVQGSYFTGRDKANEIASCINNRKCKAYKPAKEEI